jgi:hypothetical protein
MGQTQEVVRARPSFHVSLHQQLPFTAGPTLWGTDSWLRSEWFPSIVCDLVGKGNVNFKPSTTEGTSDMYLRKVENFIPEASESPQGEFWRTVLTDQKKRRYEHDMELHNSLPFHPVYVYSSRFLASVCLLVYEVL